MQHTAAGPACGEPRERMPQSEQAVAVNSRYYCNDSQSIRAVVQRADNLKPPSVEARLVDISECGVKLSLAKNIPRGEEVTLRLEAAGLKLSAAAVIRWSQLTRGERWHVGCEFMPRLDEECLTKLAEAGHLERRRSPRQDANVFSTARWELDDTVHAVLVKDISPGGFCVVCPGAAFESKLLTLEPGEEGISVTGSVRWQRRTARGYLVGCALVNDIDFSVLQEAVHRMQSERRVAGSSWGVTYQRLGTTAFEDAEWSKAERYFHLALEMYFAHRSDALNSAVVIRTLARIWKASKTPSLPKAVAQTLDIELTDAEMLLHRALEDEAADHPPQKPGPNSATRPKFRPNESKPRGVRAWTSGHLPSESQAYGDGARRAGSC